MIHVTEEVITPARRFVLRRDEDFTGTSGTGIVVEGIQFWDGTIAMRWRSDTASTTIFDSIEDVEKIHGHEGRTRVCWIDVPGQTWCSNEHGEDDS